MQKFNVHSPQYLKLLIYGVAGSGKTRLAASSALCEQTSPVLMLNIHGNPVSLRDYTKVPDILTLESLKDLNNIYTYLYSGQTDLNKYPDLKDILSPQPYKTIVIDTLTAIQRLIINKVTNNDITKAGDTPLNTTQQNYGQVLAHTVKIATLFYKLDLNVIFTAQEVEKDEDGKITTRPMLLGQSCNEVLSLAYAVGRTMTIDGMKHKTKKDLNLTEIMNNAQNVVAFKPTSTFYAKDQYLSIPDVVENPTIAKIYNYINKE